MSYPIDGGETFNMVAFDTVNEWNDEKWIVPGRYEELLERYQGWGEHAQGVLKVSYVKHSAPVPSANNDSSLILQISLYGAYGKHLQPPPLPKAK